MDTWLIANILRLRRTLRRREGWTRERLLGHQQHELATLRAFAAERSPFYRRLHHGLRAAPLAELPVLTKATMMGHFDEIVTDPTLHLAGLQTYLEQLHGNEPFAGRYWVSATSGSSGRKSVIPGDAHEWAMTIASYSGANEWSGIQASPLHPVRMAVVSSTTAWHWSSRVAATVRSPFIHSEHGRGGPATRYRRPAQPAAPRHPDRVRLDDPHPRRRAARRAAAHRPAHGELRLGGAHRRDPGDGDPGLGSTAVQRLRRHRDRRNRRRVRPAPGHAPVRGPHHRRSCRRRVPARPTRPARRPPAGHRAVQPDPPAHPLRDDRPGHPRHRAVPGRLPFRLLESIDGRTDDIVMLPASAGGSTRIHPVVFHRVLDLLDAPAWQVRQHGPDITVLVAAPGPQAGLTATEEAVRAALAAAGAQPQAISLSVVDTIPAGAADKRPLVVADKATTGHV